MIADHATASRTARSTSNRQYRSTASPNTGDLDVWRSLLPVKVTGRRLSRGVAQMVLGCAVGASWAGGSAVAGGAPGGDPRRDGGRGDRGHRHPRAAAPPLADPRGGDAGRGDGAVGQ